MRPRQAQPPPSFSLSLFFLLPHPPLVQLAIPCFSSSLLSFPPSFPFSPCLVLFNTFQPTTTSSAGWLQWGCGHVSTSRPRSGLTYYGADPLRDPGSARAAVQTDPKASGITLQNRKRQNEQGLKDTVETYEEQQVTSVERKANVTCKVNKPCFTASLIPLYMFRLGFFNWSTIQPFKEVSYALRL